MARRVMVLFNRPQSNADHPSAASEHMVVEIAEFLAEELSAMGDDAFAFALPPDPTALWSALRERRPDVVVNLYEGTLDDPETESYVAGLLHWSGVPFTGCPLPCLTLARAKQVTKRVLKGAGLPTAEFVVVESDAIPEWHGRWPVFVKPALQDASVGISAASRCDTPEAMRIQVRALLDRFGPPVLVEEYVDGREIVVALTALPELRWHPPAEILFPAGAKFLTYDAKWARDSADYQTTPPVYPADIPSALAERLGELAMAAFRVLGARDYARVDFRVDAQNNPYILELNPNPEISDDACFGLILQSGGVSFRSFLASLVDVAARRGPRA